MNMASTEIDKTGEVLGAEQCAEEDVEHYYDSSESFNAVTADSGLLSSGLFDSAQFSTPSQQCTAQQATTQDPEQPTAKVRNEDDHVKTKVTYRINSPKTVRRSQRTKKRKRVEHLSRSLQGDSTDDFTYIEGLSSIEQSFNSRMSKLEQTFENLMIAQSKQADAREAKHTLMLKELLKDVDTKVSNLVEQKVEEKTKKMSAEIDALRAEIAATNKSVKQQTTANDQKIEQAVQDITSKVSANAVEPMDGEMSENVQDQLQHVKQQLCDVNAKIDSQSHKFEQLELHSRKLNLIFEGVQLHDRESCKYAIERILHRNLQLDVRGAIDIAHTLGDRAEGKSSPIIVRFTTVMEKQRVLENSHVLRRQGIFVRPDFPASITERRNYVAKSLAAAKEIDPRARLLRDQLQFRGELYSVENIHEAPIGDKHHTTYTSKQVRFYGYNSPFSNFHKSPFKLHDVSYNCVEQALQAHRAYRNRDNVTWVKIMAEKNPVIMKRLGRLHKPKTTQDEQVDIKLMEDAVFAKFEQNPALKARLVATQNRSLLECNPYDSFYSTGLRMSDRRLDKGNFHGKNHMGSILESVRSKFLQ